MSIAAFPISVDPPSAVVEVIVGAVVLSVKEEVGAPVDVEVEVGALLGVEV